MSLRIWFATPRAYLTLGAVVLLFRIATALPIEHAGYMDASYTIHVAERLAHGEGFTEQVLWNYLDAPTGLPHPSNLYWMPLPAVLAAASFLTFGVSYHAAQVPFILLSVVPPLFAFFLAIRIYSSEGGQSDRAVSYAWMAGLLVTFSGFYTIYWVAPDNFTPFAITADLCLLLVALAALREKAWTQRIGDEGTRGKSSQGSGAFWWLGAGIMAGLSQLSRADGFLLLAVVPASLLAFKCSPRAILRPTIASLAGFLLIMSPWLARNYLAVGGLLPPGGGRTLFLTAYDDLFRYNTGDLTWARYWDWGLANIAGSKLNALGFDLLVLIFGGLEIFLAPLALIGLWQLRRRAEFVPFLIYLALLTFTMSIVFTFPGIRGSMLHSSIALVPYFAVAVPLGLDSSIHWIAKRRRRWDVYSATQFFRAGAIVLAIGLSIFLYSQGVFGFFSTGPSNTPLWNARDAEYASIGRHLESLRVPPEQPVMTVDPPSFFGETERSSIYLPTDGAAAVFQAARQLGSHYLVLENDHPIPLNGLYAGRDQVAGLTAVGRWADALGRPVILYRVGD